jgi:hypothetical protein
MRKIFLLVTMVLLAVVLLTSGVDTAAAEPQKNQILLPATCDNRQSYTFVINGMSKVGQIIGSNNNIVIKSFTVTYFEPPPSGAFILEETFDQGNKEGLQRDLINCTGITETELQGLGRVTADFEFQGVALPRGAK